MQEQANVSPAPVTRCKMRVAEVTHELDQKGAVTQERVKLYAVCDNTPANRDWAKWTPSANFEIYISNPAAFNKLSKGHEYFVDFTPAS